MTLSSFTVYFSLIFISCLSFLDDKKYGKSEQKQNDTNYKIFTTFQLERNVCFVFRCRRLFPSKYRLGQTSIDFFRFRVMSSRASYLFVVQSTRRLFCCYYKAKTELLCHSTRISYGILHNSIDTIHEKTVCICSIANNSPNRFISY